MGDRIRTVAILGAGNGGCAAAADLTNRGFAVHLFSRNRATLQPILDRGGLELTGVVGEGFMKLARITDRIDEAVAGTDLIMTATPILAFDYFAKILAPHIRKGQILFFNPGQAGGGLYFHRCLRLAGGPPVRSVETPTLTYGTRIPEPGKTWIKTQVRNLPCGAFPAKDQDELLAVIRQLYPVLEPAVNVLETALYDVNAVEHPPGVVCNAGWIEHTKGDFCFYVEGLSPSVARVVEDVDVERLNIIRALNARTGMGIHLETFVEYFYRLGYTTVPPSGPGSVCRQQQGSPGNKVTKAPDTLDHRYMHEGIGYGLVPWREIARALGVPTPLMDSIIRLASSLMGQDYFHTGLTLEKMGLADRPVESWAKFLREGYPD
jgi:opine dehydrogenase